MRVQRQLNGTPHCPLGLQPQSALKLSRRAFVGLTISAPLSVAAAGSAAKVKASAAPLATMELQFFETEELMTVAAYRCDIRVGEWQLARRAFGPNARFFLRTLQSGAETGYELLVAKVQCGSLSDRNHYFTFIRDPQGWRVRMRTDLWGAELTSGDVVYASMCTVAPQPVECPKPDTEKSKSEQTGSEKTGSEKTEEEKPDAPPAAPQICLPRFLFKVDSSRFGGALSAMFKGHVGVVGRHNLVFDADCVWSVAPTGGRLLVAPYSFELEALELAWCEPKSANETSEHERASHPGLGNGVRPEGEVIGRDHRPVDRAAQANAVTDLKSPADPVFCAGGPLKSARSLSIGLSGEDGFRGSLGGESTISFSYVCEEWGVGSQTYAVGRTTLSGDWLLETRYDRRATLACVSLAADLVAARDEAAPGAFRMELSGAVSAASAWLESRIGRLKVKGWDVPVTTGRQEGGNAEAEGPPPRKQQSRDLPGVRMQLRYHASDAGLAVLWMEVPLLLLESEIAPADTDSSALTFAPTLLMAVYGRSVDLLQQRIGRSNSILWLGSPNTLPAGLLARVDLARARLDAVRSHDLLSLSFSFAGLFLLIDSHGLHIESDTDLCLEETSPPFTSAEESEPSRDLRPILVVEFPPQHVFEQALFRPSLSDFPEVVLVKEGPAQPSQDFLPIGRDRFSDGLGGGFPGTDDPIRFSKYPDKLCQQLALLSSAKDRTMVRTIYAAAKTSVGDEDATRFKTFAARFKDRFKQQFSDYEKLEDDSTLSDQVVYIGPYGMDPDVRAVARVAMQDVKDDELITQLGAMISEANGYVQGLVNQNAGNTPISQKIWEVFQELLRTFDNVARTSLATATGDCEGIPLFREISVARVLPEFSYFRDFYRQRMTELSYSNQPKSDPDIGDITASACDMEYFCASNRDWATAEQRRAFVAREKDVRDVYKTVLLGRDPVPHFVRARLANPSRLAFRIRCTKPHEFTVSVGARRPAYELAFSLAALTDWRQYELVVTPKARAVVPLDEAGRLLPDSAAAAVQTDNGVSKDSSTGSSDIGMLQSLGIRSGRYITAEQRLADVESVLRVMPHAHETAIELPARLILSPSQRAIWRTPQDIAGVVFGRQRTDTGPQPIWNAALAIELQPPELRVVYSPDLRPGTLRQGLERLASGSRKPDRLHMAVESAPPRGPRAPWTLGVEDGDPTASTADDIAKVLKSNADAHPLVKYLRARKTDAKEFKTTDTGILRSSLDAYDRHELVILSSAWGLPVTGRREQNGQVQSVSLSSQIEPPEQYRVIDLEPGTAMYRPRELKVQELRLTALGGTLRHDTDFVPPAPANHLEYNGLFPAFSIERWQHWIVLGRDVFAEVVYKGYLFPIGHRASLIKQTERIFLRSALPTEGEVPSTVRAFLRQRMFIRIGDPIKPFPAPRQPNFGRQFPAQTVRMLTVNTPDIVDPAQDPPPADSSKKGAYDIPSAPLPGGRLFPSAGGLVFWPRTSRIAGSEVRFEALIEKAFVRIPLIFVDNVAVNDPQLLAALVMYYNTQVPSPDPPATAGEPSSTPLGPIVRDHHLRTVDFASQLHRYCDEVKPGSVTHKTVSWTLRASGCVNTPPADPDAAPDAGGKPQSATIPWEGDNTLYHDPSLESVDQPPFYPAVETARIRLDQVERLSGQQSEVALVQFDGFYIATGFAKPDPQHQDQGDGDKNKDVPRRRWYDPAEIYLTILNDVSFTMGAAGDRSGGVYHPASKLVALSRQRGPLGGLPNPARPLVPVLISRAGLYSSAEAARGPAAGTLEDRKKDYQAYFPDPDTRPGGAQVSRGQDVLNTKLLGLISLHDLVGAVSALKPAAQGLPVLREVIHYGVAGAADASAELIRSHVIEPLRKLMSELEAAWQRLDAEIVKRTSGTRALAQVSVAAVFPEIDQGLTDLHKTLSKAAAESDAIAFYATLAEVYESGKRLLDALGRAAANPLERLYLAVAAQAQRLIPDIQQFAGRLGQVIASSLAGAEKSLSEGLVSVCKSESLRPRFLPLPADRTVDAKTLNNAIDSAFQALTQDKTPDEAVAQFWNTLQVGEKVPYAPLRDALVSLLRPLDNLYRGLHKNDVRSLATAAEQLLDLFGPHPDLPSGVEFPAVKDLAIALRNSVQVSLIALDAASADGKGPKLLPPVQAFIAAASPEVLQQVTEPLREAIQHIVDRVSDLQRELNTKAGQLREALGYVGYFSQQNQVGELRLDELGAALAAQGELFKVVDELLLALLPDQVPLGNLDAAIDAKIGKPVRDALDAIFRMQSEALQWIDYWKKITANDKDPLQVQVKAYADKVGNAQQTLEAAVMRWSVWVGARTNLLQPLDLTDSGELRAVAIASFNSVLGTSLSEWWSALLGRTATDITQGITAGLRAMKTPVGKAADAYGELLKIRNKSYAEVNATTASLSSVLLVPIAGAQAPPTPDSDQLAADKALLESFAGKNDPYTWLHDAGNYHQMLDFLVAWEHGNSTPERIVKQALRITLEDLRSQLLGLIDFSHFYEQLDALIRQLVPASATLTYDFHLDLDEDAKKASGGIFIPHQGCKLTINSTTTVDLIRQSVSFHAGGDIGPFDIALVGTFIDAVTIKFDGAHFESTAGGTHCDVRYVDFKIGPALKFVEDLASWFKPKEGSGFYLVPLSGALGIEAGYGLNIGTISLGDISFFNITLNAAMRLPFDGNEATFVMSLSRRDAPFTISAAPYGGSGYFAIEANAKGIVGFEASFEYGGAGAFSYGPLSGKGRLMIGIFIRQKREPDKGVVTDIYATFFAGGSAAIWIFSFGASLYVCASMHDNTMVGDATFTFSFSMGLVDFDYQVNVHKEIKWGGSGAGRNRELPRAPLDGREDRMQRVARRDGRAKLRVDSWCQGEHWGRHRAHSDFDIDMFVEEFV